MTRGRSELVVDLSAIAANLRAVRAVAGRGVWLCAALKADAYGFGLLAVARAVKRAGADAIGAGSVDDGIRLREAGIDGPLLVYGGDLLTATTVSAIESHHLMATIHDERSLRACVSHASRSVDVMIEVEVGLGRLGFDASDALDAILAVERATALRLRGVYTHMRVPERGARTALREQMRRFESVASQRPSLIAMAASSRVLDLMPQMGLNAVDVGRAVYGLLPRRGGHLGHRLRPAFAKLASRLIAVRDATGSRPRLGVIPYGRAGGMAALHVGHVLVSGRRAAVIGDPSLEHTRVDLSRHAGARVGDEVVIVGRQRASTISVEDVLRAHRELPATGVALAVGALVPRVYSRGRRIPG